MTIDPRYFELMPTLVVWNPYTGEDEWGNDTFGPDVSLRVRIEPITVTRAVGTSQAGAVQAEFGHSTRIICDLTDPRMAPSDHITIVEDDNVLVIQSAMVQYDEFGPYYQELNCNESEAPEDE